MIDADIRLFFEAVGTVERDAESNRFDHLDMVGPVAGREHVARLQAPFIAQPRQGIQFRGAAEDRLLDRTGRFPVFERTLVDVRSGKT